MSGELTDGSAVKREQGRRANQLRALASEQAVLHRADGSATFSHGDTRCTASVYGPGQPASGVPRSRGSGFCGFDFGSQPDDLSLDVMQDL